MMTMNRRPPIVDRMEMSKRLDSDTSTWLGDTVGRRPVSVTKVSLVEGSV